MGEVPEILVERKYLKQLKQHACTIERLFGVHLLLSDHDDRYDDDADDDDDDDNDDELNNKFVLDATKENNAITKLGDVCSSRQQQDEEQVFVRVEVFTNTLSGNSVSKNVLGIMSGDKKHHNDHSTLSLPAVEKQHSRFLSDQIVAKVQRYVDCTVLECGDGNNTSAEAEDSSYDSDFETEEQPVNQTQPSSTIHSGVSRTTSDTLAAEFAEYVTVEKVPGTHSPGYTARVEFALKLGYTEKLVQAALHKLGPDPEQNELLAELIRLGASSTKLSDSPDETNITQDHENASDDVRRASAINSAGLRPVVIDGSNVAMSHGNKEVFSCRGIKICVDWFRSRGHKEITVFVPKWRKEASRPDNPIADQEILGELERDRLLVFTPSRLIGGKRMVCYDDRYILRLAAELDGIVVSNDNYRDLAQESPEFRKVVGERILMYSFVNDRFMPPDDPLGRSGPTLENFLKIGSTKRTDPAPPCPYAKKCTYGNKCKFRHPERGPHPQKSVTERLVEHAQRHLQARVQSLSLPLSLSNPNVGNTMKNNNATAIASATSASTHQPLCKAWSAHHTSVGKTMSSPVSKSKSVENIPDCSMKKLNYGQQLSPGQVSQALPSCAAWPAPHVNNNVDQPDQPVNMHKKLQRQLTLNPTCDPRLYQLMKYRQPQPPLSVPGNRPNVHHRFLEKRTSADSRSASINWNPSDHHHQHLTRISSAPDSSQGWQSRGTLIAGHATRNHRLGTSEPQLNSPSPSPMGISQASSWAQDARRHLHYHLANIFPQEQVQTALAMYPHETDPQKICATILAMFPKS